MIDILTDVRCLTVVLIYISLIISNDEHLFMCLLAIYMSYFVVVVQWLSHVQFFVTPWTVAWQASLSFTISQSLLEFMPIESVILSNHLILCCPLLLPSIFPSIRVFPNESTLHIRWSNYCSFSLASVLRVNIQGWIAALESLKKQVEAIYFEFSL